MRLAGDYAVPVSNTNKSATVTAARSRNMAAIHRTDTKPEIAVRSLLHRAGLRYRKDFRVVCGEVKTRPDIVFTRRKVAVFIDGCFWHGCPTHGRTPKSNTDYWIPKLDRNRSRDHLQTEALRAHGWIVLRFWTHEDPEFVADQIVRQLNTAR